MANLNKKAFCQRILVLVVKQRHHANGLLSLSIFWIVSLRHLQSHFLCHEWLYSTFFHAKRKCDFGGWHVMLAIIVVFYLLLFELPTWRSWRNKMIVISRDCKARGIIKVLILFAHPGTTGSSVERIRESRTRESFNKVSDECTCAEMTESVLWQISRYCLRNLIWRR